MFRMQKYMQHTGTNGYQMLDWLPQEEFLDLLEITPDCLAELQRSHKIEVFTNPVSHITHYKIIDLEGLKDLLGS